MKPLWIKVFLLLLLLSGVAAVGQDVELADRIVAVVDEDAILASDIDRVVGLGLIEPHEGEDVVAFQRRVLDLIIEQRLRFHEIDRFGFSELSMSEVDHAYQEMQDRFTSGELEARLENLGMSGDDLRQLVARQLMVVTYVDERLGARVFVSSGDIQRYFDETLVPELRRQGEPIPELDSIREQIRGVVKQQRLDDEIARWTEELRLEADIEDYFDERSQQLPDLVLGVESTAGRGPQ